MDRARRLTALPTLAWLALALVGCRSNALPPSEWPPADFALEVRESFGAGSGARSVRSFRVWADGLAAYRASESDLPSLHWAQPVFDTLAVYRLDPHSVRALCRGLQAAGLFREEAGRAQNETLPGTALVIRWTAQGAQGSIALGTHDRVQVERAVEAIAGFLPPSVRFLDIEAEAPRLSEVPEPKQSLAGAVHALRDLARSRPTDFDLVLDLFVAAVAAHDPAIAQVALTELQNENGREVLGDEAELVDWKKDALPQLRALLPAPREDG